MSTRHSGRRANGGCGDYRFPRCKKQLPSNKEKCRRVLECIILVHNFRTQVVGHNQIYAVFVPEYERVINIHGNDRIHRYYLVEPGDYETDDEAKLWRRTLETTKKLKMDFNIWGLVN